MLNIEPLKYSLAVTNLGFWKLCQKTENGGELFFASNSSIYHAVSGYQGEISLKYV